MANGRIVSNSGRGVQLQNLPRPTLKQKDIDLGVEAICSDSEELFFDDVMGLCTSAVRGCIIAALGRKLVVSDLSNIEGRMAAWLAGEHWKLKAFREFDEGRGHDLYRLAYAGMFKIKPEDVDGGAKSGPMRMVGKISELMLQYGGGVGAFLTGALGYGIDLEVMTKKALPEIPPLTAEQAQAWWEESVRRKMTYDLSRDVFVACDGLKRLWRNAHPAISSIWPKLEAAVINTIENKNTVYEVGRLGFVRNGNWLRMILPSGFCLCYASPRVSDKGEISYMGMNQYTRKWGRLKTYGGKIFENATQAAARDVLAWNMPLVEERGFPIVTHVHDELITEPPDEKKYTAKLLSQLMATNPAWAPGLPLAAGGFESKRYRKDG